MAKIYTNEMIDFIYKNHKGESVIELTNIFNEKFNMNVNVTSIQNLKSRLKKRGLNFGKAKNNGQFKKGQKSPNKGLKWDDYMSEQGKLNSMKTAFKKGNKSWNCDPIGTEKWKKHSKSNDEGFLYIKVQDGHKQYNWKQKHRIIWEKVYGEIPKGHKVIFKDGNRHNITIDNLALVTNSQMLILNRRGLIYNNVNLTEIGINIAKVIDKTNKVAKK